MKLCSHLQMILASTVEEHILLTKIAVPHLLNEKPGSGNVPQEAVEASVPLRLDEELARWGLQLREHLPCRSQKLLFTVSHVLPRNSQTSLLRELGLLVMQ